MRGFDAWWGMARYKRVHFCAKWANDNIGVAAVLTFGNPHVYLDTIVLIGIVSLHLKSTLIAFGVGAPLPVLCFLPSWAMAPSIVRDHATPNAWRILDATVAVVMLVLAFGMARAGGWM